MKSSGAIGAFWRAFIGSLWAQLRREIEPVTAAQFEQFLFRWQHVLPGSQLHGVDGTLQIIKQLQGYEISAAAWEPEVLARRIARYEPDFLDQLCLAGEVMWARLSPHPAFEDSEPRRVRPTRTAPIAIFLRESADWLASRAPSSKVPNFSHPAARSIDATRTAGRIVLRRSRARLPAGWPAKWRMACGNWWRRAGDGRRFREPAFAGGSQAPPGRRAGKAGPSAPCRRPLGVDPSRRELRSRRGAGPLRSRISFCRAGA